MKFVALLTIVDQEKNKEVRPAHLDYINGLFKEGKVTAAGPFTDGKGGMVIYEADSYEAALQLAQNDPVVVEQARTLELREWSALSFPLD
ncbi:YciI family protein [Aneurinibacillus sp. Ricciae_BoGa-3]|uniref:YciI family protein n=1 Tax=Aneurinibacillus sp. Ricciae_BoGa-3 TaxID=3022697 RepID=UPI0023400224|nr:YciI family protein [Aneurinibacillus sp. Ricciae_BoGa-3]WCK53977.1 YciI family protein [Aneurinibacillus sp. Ricciae_BoGa-3]